MDMSNELKNGMGINGKKNPDDYSSSRSVQCKM